MIVIEWILFIFSWLFFVAGVFVVFSCFVGLMRFKDFFVRLHAIKISNIYGISFILFAKALSSNDILVFLQLMMVIILDILITITISHSISRTAINNNIAHGGFSRRKYNEMLSQKEKEEAEKRMQERIKMEQEKANKNVVTIGNGTNNTGNR